MSDLFPPPVSGADHFLPQGAEPTISSPRERSDLFPPPGSAATCFLPQGAQRPLGEVAP